MKIKLLFILVFFYTLISISSAQTLEEIVRYSTTENIGTARMLGAGGAFGALGGEQGAVLINPASVATFKKGEIAISPMSLSSKTTTIFADNSFTESNANQLHAFNMGAVFSKGDQSSKWKYTNFMIAYNKVSELDQKFTYSGISPGTIVERFAERANGLDLNQLDPFEAGVAYDSGALIGPDTDLNYTFDAFPDQELGRMQFADYEGGINELSFSLGGNYNDQIHLGMSIGFSFLNFSSTKSYSEEALDDRSPFRSLTYSESLETSGNGINFKAGAILTAFKPFRIGIAVASPTTYSLNDIFTTSMEYTYEIDQVYTGFAEPGQEGEFDYQLSTPWRYTGSFAYILSANGLNGFLSADIDFLNYRNSSFNLTSDGNDAFDLERDLNDQINVELKQAINVRLGAEIAYDIYRVRLGYGLNGSPYAQDNLYFGSLSGGVGLRFDKFFFDIGARRQNFQQGYLPYVSLNEENIQLVQIDNRKTYLVGTFGLKF